MPDIETEKDWKKTTEESFRHTLWKASLLLSLKYVPACNSWGVTETSGPTDSNWSGTGPLRKVENQLLRHLEFVLLKKKAKSIKSVKVFLIPNTLGLWLGQQYFWKVKEPEKNEQTNKNHRSSWIINRGFTFIYSGPPGPQIDHSHSFLIFHCKSLIFHN